VASASDASTSVAKVREAFDRQANVDYIASIKGEDLDVSKDGASIVISFEYEKRIPLVANATLLLEFAGSSKD
jgi:hypothetical protein